MSVKNIIQSLGGACAVGRRLGVRSQAVSQWGMHDRIPLDRVPDLLRMASEQGVDLNPEDLRGDFDWAAVCCCYRASAA